MIPVALLSTPAIVLIVVLVVLVAVLAFLTFWGNKQQEQEVTMLTPVKAIKGEETIITQREKAAKDLFSTAVSKVRHPIESFFNWLNEKTNIQRAMKVRSTSELLVHTMGKIAIAFIYLIF